MSETIEALSPKIPFWKISKREARLLLYFNIFAILSGAVFWTATYILTIITDRSLLGLYYSKNEAATWPEWFFKCLVLSTGFFAFISFAVLIAIFTYRIIFYMGHRRWYPIKTPLLFTSSLFATISIIRLTGYIIGITYPPFALGV